MSRLVINRKAQESVFIGDDIVVTVVRIDPFVVRLSIEAPRDVLVLRDELLVEDDCEGITP